MNLLRKITALTILLWLLSAVWVYATPSSTVWTNCSIDFQKPGLTRITDDNYSAWSDADDDSVPHFPTNYGLEWGSAIGHTGLSAEYGFDFLTPADNPFFFNAKIGYPEGVLSPNGLALELGLFGFGTKSGITAQNIAQLITGRTLPHNLGRLQGSIYAGNVGTLKSSTGETQNTGFMLAYDRMMTDKIWFGTDYASGDNAIGGYAVAFGYYFTNDISMLAGPVWFNDTELNGKMKITVQLDLNF